MDIAASDPDDASNIDGILIPRINNFPFTEPTGDQDGMLVFLTGSGIPSKGLYYWNEDEGGDWLPMDTIKEDAHWYEELTTTSAGDISDNIYTMVMWQFEKMTSWPHLILRMTAMKGLPI